MRAAEEQLEVGSDTGWIGAAVLTGILTMACGMFAVIVAILKVMIETIPGLPPDLRRLPKGCSFALWCCYATEARTATVQRHKLSMVAAWVRCTHRGQ